MPDLPLAPVRVWPPSAPPSRAPIRVGILGLPTMRQSILGIAFTTASGSDEIAPMSNESATADSLQLVLLFMNASHGRL